jgi:hypothetical protein
MAVLDWVSLSAAEISAGWTEKAGLSISRGWAVAVAARVTVRGVRGVAPLLMVTFSGFTAVFFPDFLIEPFFGGLPLYSGVTRSASAETVSEEVAAAASNAIEVLAGPASRSAASGGRMVRLVSWEQTEGRLWLLFAPKRNKDILYRLTKC